MNKRFWVQVLFLILWFVPAISYSVPGSRETMSFAGVLEGESGFFAFFLIFHIAAMIYVAFPLVRKDMNKRRRFIIPMISMFLTAAMWALIVHFVIDWKNDYADYGAQWGFTFGGWLFLIIMISLFVMPIWLYYQSEAICIQNEKAGIGRNAYAESENPMEEPIPEGGWRCSCGKAHASYVSSCSCGANKSQQR